MQSKQFYIRKVAVLGAGMMGTQLAAHFANAGVESLLFDHATKDGDPNALVKQAISALVLQNPSSIAHPSNIDCIQAANYEHDLSLLKECDLIIESISGRLDWKMDLLKKVSPHLSLHAFIVSNTCGLSIEKLSTALLEPLRSHFAGIQFFNPPRFRPLVEVIPHAGSNRYLLEQLETFLVSILGKVVVYARDCPNFICNRIGLFSVLSANYHAEQFGLSPDGVDLLAGTLIGRPRSAVFHALDKIGLDTFAQGLQTLQEGIEKDSDPFDFLYKMPPWMAALIQKGALGEKTRAGIYRKIKQELQIVDKQGNYRAIQQKLHPEIASIFKYVSSEDRLRKLRESALPEGQFLWALFRDLFHYAAFHLATIAESCRDVDLALRYGYGWEKGPFETWQEAGWKTITNWIEEDIRAKRSLCTVPLPSWVHERAEMGVYRDGNAYSPARGIYIGHSKLPVYDRQISVTIGSAAVGSEAGKRSVLTGRLIGSEPTVIFETDAVKMFCIENDNIDILSFKTAGNLINEGILIGLQEAVSRAERDQKRGLIIWQGDSKHFSLGSDLKILLHLIQRDQSIEINKILKTFQETMLLLQNSKIPTVAAIQGKVLGAGCELMLHCSHIVAALESYPGFIDATLGLIPAAAGCKEIALKASREASEEDPFPNLRSYFKTLSNGVLANSATDAKCLGFLKASDVVIMNPKEILYLAKQLVLRSSESNYRPPFKRKIKVAGKSGWASLQVDLLRMREKDLITDHDFLVRSSLAKVLCGGDVEGGVQVYEEWLLELERQTFIELLQIEKTQERITKFLSVKTTLLPA